MPRSFAQPATASPALYSLPSDLWSVSFLPQGDSPAYFKVCFFGMSLGITGSYPLPELPLTFQAFLRLYFLALLSSELLVVVKIILLFLLYFSELDKCKNPSTPERDHQEECAREREQHQMTSTTNHWEHAAAPTVARMSHQAPPPPHPFPHLALQQPQRHSGDPFVQPPIAGSSHIPNPQPLNPSPRDQVADIHAQLAAIQQQQPPPARRRQQSAVQTASGVNNVPLGTAEVARMCAQAKALQQRQVAPATTTATTAATSTTASSTTATITTTCT
ncbi:hypothetical protein K439DRAFT_1620346 [Ramaria rubella]|nr:hypothetical protein K439DRAFT_1620346 [Ramaria rubella]